jgi:hypothetical protein
VTSDNTQQDPVSSVLTQLSTTAGGSVLVSEASQKEQFVMETANGGETAIEVVEGDVIVLTTQDED